MARIVIRITDKQDVYSYRNITLNPIITSQNTWVKLINLKLCNAIALANCVWIIIKMF